jgi:hypothetical protein
MLVHAAGESSPGNLPRDTYAVVLAVKDEAALARVEETLKEHGVQFVPVHEPDPPYFNQLMSIGVVPGKKKEVGRYLSSIPLYR